MDEEKHIDKEEVNSQEDAELLNNKNNEIQMDDTGQQDHVRELKDFKGKNCECVKWIDNVFEEN